MAVKTQGLRIRTKLLAMVLLLVSFSIAVGAGTFYGLSNAMDNYRPHLLPALEAAHSMETIVAQARRYEKEFFLFSGYNNNEKYKKKQAGYHQQLLATYNKIPEQLKILSVGKYDEFSSFQVRKNLTREIRAKFDGTQKLLEPLAEKLLGGTSFFDAQNLYTPYKLSIRELDESIANLRAHLVEAVAAQNAASIKYEADTINTLLIVGCGIVILGFLIGIYVSKRITVPLDKLMEGVESIGQGNFTEVQINSKDEFQEIGNAFNETFSKLKTYIKSDEERKTTEENVINFLEVVSEASDGDLTLRAPVTEDAFGTIADSYNLMIESLAALLTDTTINAEEVGEESRQLLEIFRAMKEGADNQLAHVASANDAAEETAQSATQIADKAALAQRAAASVEEATNIGNERVNKNIEGMQLIRVTVQVINKKMKSLAERLLEIGTISQLISDVATRTTILAMNASIEASRAGEQGRGFLVISDEIKRLADEASEATRQIGGIIKAIQSEANEVTLALEEETSTVEEQTKIAQDTGEALAEIQQATTESKQVVTEITKLSQEQQKISDDMVATIRQMSEITADTSSMITTSAQISEGLNGVSESLLQSLSQFRLVAEEEEPLEIEEIPTNIVNETFVTPSEEEDYEQDMTAV